MTSTLKNTTDCCRGFEDIKDENNNSFKASDIFGLFLSECAAFGLKI